MAFGAPGAQINLSTQFPNAFLVAGAGNETLNAGGSADRALFYAGPGNTSMVGGNGNNFFVGGAGNTTISGGLNNGYAFIRGASGGVNLIKDFVPNHDAVLLVGYGLGANDGIASETQQNGSTILQLTDGTRIEFQNIANPSVINSSIFHS